LRPALPPEESGERREAATEAEPTPPEQAAPPQQQVAKTTAKRPSATTRPRRRKRRAAPQPTAPEVCEIKLSRGRLKWQFYAGPPGNPGAFRLPTAQASEPFLRLRNEDNPTDAAEEALAALIDELVLNGWQVVSEGPRWYDYRLELG
jgi:hypothetical protein